MVDTIKFSQMTDGGDLNNNDKVPGLLGGANVLFNNPWTFLPPGTTAQRPAPAADMYYRLRFNIEEQLYEYYDAILGAWTQLQESLFTQGPFIIYEADPSIPDAQNLGALANGILKQTISAGSATLDIAVNEIDYYGPGMVGYLQAPAGVRDINGNIMLQFQPEPAAVNAIAIQNAFTAADPGFNAIGSDTNIGLGYAAKGNGLHKFYSTAEIPFQIQNGTGYQRVNQFRFEDVSGGFVYTFPQASGTIALTSGVATSIEGTENQVLVNGTFGSPVTGDVILTLPQDIGTTSSPTFFNLQLDGGGIADGAGNDILHFSPTPSAVNYFAISNVATGNIPVFAVTGSDTDISMGLDTKGTGIFNLKSAALTNQFKLNVGATYNSVINNNYPSNTNTRTYTWQDASGTVAFLSDIPSVVPAALTRVNDTNVTLTLGGTPTTALLQSTSLTMGWTGQLALTRGGSNASLTASNGGIVYSTASAMAILSGTATAGLALLSGASAAPTWSTGKPITRVVVQLFTSGGIYTPTTGLQYALSELVGGGGGGGGSAGAAVQSGASAGGGAGGYARSVFSAATIGASQTVTIGAGGSGGSAGNNVGTAGGATSLGSLLVANGGSGGGGGPSSATPVVGAIGGSGGTATTGDFLVNGQNGGYGAVLTVGSVMAPGNGGSSMFGLGGVWQGAGPGTNGINGSGYGAGGSGTFGNNGTTAAGGNGTGGCIRITEFISI